MLSSLARLHINDCGQGSSIVATSYLPSVFCNKGIFSASAQRAPYWATFKDGDSEGNGNPAVGATLKQAGPASGAASSGLTGLYGFLSTADLGQTDMITLAYTNPFLALATPGYRPSASATDTAVGFDSVAPSAAGNAQLAFRAPVAISEYIGSVFDNGSYKERLTSSAKTFNVPVTAPTVNVTSGYQLNGSSIQASTVVVAFCLGTVGTTSGTFVLTPGTSITNANCSGTTTAVEMPMPYACTAKNLYVVAGTGGNNGTGSGITTLFKNNSATSVKCTVGTSTSCHDISDSITLSAGDRWSIRTTSNGAGETLANVRAAFQCQ